MASNGASESPTAFPTGLPVFTGLGLEYTVIEFLALVHANVQVLPRPPQAVYISNLLRGRALLWYAASRTLDSYDQLQTALIQDFNVEWRSGMSQERQLRLLQQGFGTVYSYAAEFKRLCNECEEDVDTEYNLRWFAWGLRREVRDLVFTEPGAFGSFARLVSYAEHAAALLGLETRSPSPSSESAGTRLRRTYADSVRKAKSWFFTLKRSPDLGSGSNQSVDESHGADDVSYSFQSVSEPGLDKSPTPSPRRPPSTRGRLRSFTSHPEIMSDFGLMGRRRTPDVPTDASPRSNGSSRSPAKSSPPKTPRSPLSP